jgi:ABC-type sulfate transport system permease component
MNQSVPEGLAYLFGFIAIVLAIGILLVLAVVIISAIAEIWKRLSRYLKRDESVSAIKEEVEDGQ